MKRERINYLLDAYTSGRITKSEESELMDWILEAEDNDFMKDYVLKIWNQHRDNTSNTNVDWDELYAEIIPKEESGKTKNVRTMRRWMWAAAVTTAVILSVSYFYFTSNDTPISGVATEKVEKDIAPPTGNKAILILADGTMIEMDTTGSGQIAMQGDTRIERNEDGTIAYLGTAGERVSFNTFEVPKGSKPLSLMLADGSKVWLNSGSKLTFPVAFLGNERVVDMEGEAYFEVAHNPAKPFKVINGGVAVEVLGTHFNVNGYREDGAERITLLEGSVVVNHQNDSKKLTPGQQALVSENGGGIEINKDVDLKVVMAWREGKFVFSPNMDIHDIVNQLARWYDVDVEYQGVIKQRFWGSISKDVNLSQVLKILEATGGVKFEIDGDKIKVLPAME